MMMFCRDAILNKRFALRRGQIQHTQPHGHRPSTQFVGSLQGRFPGAET